MRRIFAYSISCLIILTIFFNPVKAQDTITFPLKIRAGFDVTGPAINYFDKNILNTEAYISVDLNEKTAVFLSGGNLNYKYSQYNYNYSAKGMYLRTGLDFNLMKPDKAQGKYYAGIGLRYGISRFTSQVPSFQHTNYWGITESSIGQTTNWGHFVEVSPGVRTEIFKNFSIGWTVSLRMLLYTTTGKDLKPIYIPGFGNGAKRASTGINYFLVWNIPYKKIRVIIKKEVPEETDETDDTGQPGTTPQPSSNRQI